MEIEKQKMRQKAGVKQWVLFILASICTVLFGLWTGYYAVLILILLFFDIYITRFVPWGTWRNVKNPQLRFIIDWVDAIVFALIGVGFINAMFFQNYQIPTSSLEKSLMVGDFLCVSKISYGGRAPMTPLTLPLTQHTTPWGTRSYLEKPQLDYKRLSGTGSIERFGVVVFNYPSGDTVALNKQDADYYILAREAGGADQILANKNVYGDVVYRPVDRRENYVKRCVGLPGETIGMKNDSVFIDGKFVQGSKNEQLSYVIQTDGTQLTEKMFNDIEMSGADKARLQMKDINQSDSVTLASLGLKYENGKGGLLYLNVNMTKGMVDELLAKNFVRAAIKTNAYYKRAGELEGRKYYQPFMYPITMDNQTEPGDYRATWIPKKGETIFFDTDVERKYHTYVRCIKNYELNDVDFSDGEIYINGEKADSYTFKMDYYFMMGDNRDFSADSRSWGFVPEDHIVGKPLFVWLSLDPDKGWFEGKIRWSRLFSSGNPD